MSTGIVSRLPGRLRLRATELKLAAHNEALCRELMGWTGVLSAEGNPRTGGILLHYDIAQVEPAAIEARLSARLAEFVPAHPAAGPGEMLWRMNRYAKWGMLGSLSGTLLALTVGKRMHAALGALHVVFLAVHLANHRNKLLK
jgi:hypothetical protein